LLVATKVSDIVPILQSAAMASPESAKKMSAASADEM